MSNTKQQTEVKQIKKYLELPHRETVISTNTLQTKPFDNQKIEIMSNNKQSSIEWYAIEMAEYLRSIYGEGIVNIDILKQAKAMHKEEIIQAVYSHTLMNAIEEDPMGKSEQYYKETFGG